MRQPIFADGIYFDQVSDLFAEILPPLRAAAYEAADLAVPIDSENRQALVVNVAVANYRDQLLELRRKNFAVMSFGNGSSDQCIAWRPRERTYLPNYRRLFVFSQGWYQRLTQTDNEGM